MDDDFQRISDDYNAFIETNKTRIFCCHSCGKEFYLEFEEEGKCQVECPNKKCRAINLVQMNEE